MISRGRTGNTKFVKQMNREGILYQLRKEPRLSRAELAARTRLSRPCVSSLVEEMIQEGLIQEVGTGVSKGGRKPILLEYNVQAYAVVGAVFEGSELEMAVADMKGELLAQEHTRLTQPVDGESALRALETTLARLLAASGVDRGRVTGIGVGLPGITQRRSGTVSYAPSTGWMDLPVGKEIEERLGLPVVLDNDVNMMTLGEFFGGAGAGVSSLVYMYVGTGIGAGIIIDKQLYRGSKEAAGEIGYMRIGEAPGRRKEEFGVFEKNFSVPGIQHKAKLLGLTVDPGISVLEQLLALEAGGSGKAGALLDEVYRSWASGIANTVSVLDPEMLILSGEMVHLDENGLSRIRELLSEWVPVLPEIRQAALRERAGMLGAVHSVLEAYPSAIPGSMS
ncbi:transcriptional regulator [Paenibacillus sp. J31TS4]|uniref:ROK family transcriptional regulator n=1 Tax=Paenibacillus sp. J31TS4 TaxID=2807195 RepID=UPI001B101E1D|nr:ROK family transcriptional regulator [Paenibacillus sp. J31TS4]GIP39287.1 transcriptional regulator [Paenibacillus sp. J31TS4]